MDVFQPTPDTYYEGYIKGMRTCGYGFIPSVGTLLGVFCDFMNSPELTIRGETEVQIGYFQNQITFASMLIAIMLNVTDTDPTNQYLYIIPLVLYFVLCAMDSLDDAKNIMAEEMDDVGFFDMFLFCKGKKEEKPDEDEKIEETTEGRYGKKIIIATDKIED